MAIISFAFGKEDGRRAIPLLEKSNSSTSVFSQTVLAQMLNLKNSAILD